MIKKISAAVGTLLLSATLALAVIWNIYSTSFNYAPGTMTVNGTQYSYTGDARFYDNGNPWWPVPFEGTTETNVTFQNQNSGFHCIMFVAQKSNLQRWVGIDTVTAPVRSNDSYMFIEYPFGAGAPTTTGYECAGSMQWNP